LLDLRRIVDTLTEKGVGFRVLQQGSIDTTRSDGRLLLNVLASFAEFELDIRAERQRDGIAKAKAAGKYLGRKASIDPAQIAALKAEGHGPSAIARKLGIGRASVYRVNAS
jgi:DNA invertase Pin-like site-specific DNA recombinase